MTGSNGHAIGTPYTRSELEGPFDAIVIGSGIGGLGAAALLAKSGGRRVLVLEQHHAAGGLTHAFRRPGYEWDVGLHYVGQVHQPGSPPRRLLEYLTEGRLAWQAMPDVYDRIRIGRLSFNYVRGESHLRDALDHAFPRERRSIARYFDAVHQCLTRLAPFYAEKVLPAMPSRLLGSALRMPFMRLARRTTAEVLDAIGMSVDLKAVLTAQWGDYGLPPSQSSFGIHAIVTSHYFEGAAYPVGGAGRLAEALLPTIERAGGALVVGARADCVLVEHGRAVGVRMADGRELRSPCVISDAGIRTTYERLIPDAASGVCEAAVGVRRLRSSLGHLCLYLGLEADRSAPQITASNLWIHPSVDFDGNLSRFVDDPEAPFPFLFVSFPSAKDPSFTARHPGRQTAQIETMAPYEHFASWRGTRWRHRGDDYDAFKTHIAQRMLRALDQRVPGISPLVRTWELSTPLSTEHFTLSSRGAAYGLAHTPARFACRDLRPRTPIEGLFLTGQDVATCGIMGALSGAVTTASVVLRRNLFTLMQGEPLPAEAREHARVA